VTSLYTKLRERNRCNNNDFQNIGVNGARMTSSSGLVDAMARQQSSDSPVLLWLSLIGNDVCNGHPNFDHMTKPDDFYRSAMETLQRLDTMLPSGSYVVALALFDGELLYDTMHALQVCSQ
jgi:acyloxyacyl hydrolase